ncbi:MAG: YraN family protein [Candidatus Babeliaceae bacterium]|jgi:putative endonuclease
MSHQRIQLGKKGEGLVATYLQQQDFSSIVMNFSCRQGEIDIIAHKKKLIAFVEVKVRNNHYCNLSEIIVPSKQKKIITTAHQYLLKYGYSPDEHIIRFDVALLEPCGADYSITYIPNAFTQQGF